MSGRRTAGAIRRCIVAHRAMRRPPRPSCSTATATSTAGAHDGVTPLHVAALKDAGRVARVLPSHGVNVDARADDGVTALHVAAMKDASGIVVALVTHGADLNATDAAGQAALHWAASEDAVAAVEALLDRGASLHTRADDGSKPLDVAVRAQALKAATLLVGARSRHRGDGRRRRRLLPGCSVGNGALRRARADDDGWSVA